MAITYPIDFPADIGVSAMTLGLDHAAASAASPFTFQEQVQVHQGNAWDVSMTLDLLERAQADTYNAFLAKLGGREGTFTFCPPGCEEPRGAAREYGVNYQPNPSDFTQDNWLKLGCTVSAAGTTPWGTTAQLLTENTETGQKLLYDDAVPVPSGTVFTYSKFVNKKDAKAFGVYQHMSGQGSFSSYDLDTLAKNTQSFNEGTATHTSGIIDYGGDWVRIWNTTTYPSPVTSINVYNYFSRTNNDANISYTGDGTSGIYVGGAQLEAGGLTPFIPYGGVLVNGAGQTGRGLAIDGLPANATGIFLPGDFVQVGTKLFRVLDQVDSNADGQATLTLAPPVRVAPADDAPIIYHSPKGIFRAKSNLTPASVAPPFVQSISFAAREAQ